MTGYRGMRFKHRAESLPFNDWNSARDFMVALGAAVDKLQNADDDASEDNHDQDEQETTK